MSFKVCLLLNSCLAALVAMPLAPTHAQDTGPGTGTRPAQPSAASPSGVSDWALAGVVWSDASLTRKLAADSLRQAQSEGADQSTQAALQQLADQSQQIIKALEQFGWSHKQSAGSEAAPDSAAPTANPAAAAAENAPASTQEIMAEKMEAARARGQAQAEAASPLKPLPRASSRMSERDGQTLSDTLPYSAGSIYDHGSYQPGGNYLDDAPMSVGASKVYSGELDEIEREVNREESAAQARAESESQPKVDPRVTAGLLRRIAMDDYTTTPQSESESGATGTSDHADARWVQFRLDANQWTYSHVQPNERMPAARAALRQLKSTAMVAGRSTQDESLKQILAPILKLSL
ncbi:hypothetical protein [Allorhodopirellula solitaria]|uniref:Uncharacterized protein n=1 Tax=Allorhodopirellula solitaria TaxID=2527987 RepID=A0A5C5XRR1_9BACT|nr:hypothetical protein [Allorhodopirellula solitaria]TWT64715.1 hypothetical protein CA85_38480 [Allorhodopirellula solitaria]